jgi:hypothetical protein
VTDENHLSSICLGPETGFAWTFEDVMLRV